MYAINALAYLPSTTTAPAPVASAFVSAQPALGNLPAQSVSAAIAYSNIADNSGRSAAQAAGTIASAPASNALLSAYSANGASSSVAGGFANVPSLFLTQLLAQNGDANTQSLAISYETLLDYAQVKYKPSNATLPPPPESPLIEYIRTLGAPPPQIAAPAQSPAPPVAASPSLGVTGQAPQLPAASAPAAQTAPAPRRTNAVSSAVASAVSAPVIAAYRAAVTRNDALSPPEENEAPVEPVAVAA